MKLAVVITQSNPEQVFTALRLANFSLGKGDSVSVFLTAEGVEAECLEDSRFDIKGQVSSFVQNGGKIEMCGSCAKSRDMSGSEACNISTMQGLYTMIIEADKVVTF